jgi:hypothetical protein
MLDSTHSWIFYKAGMEKRDHNQLQKILSLSLYFQPTTHLLELIKKHKSARLLPSSDSHFIQKRVMEASGSGNIFQKLYNSQAEIILIFIDLVEKEEVQFIIPHHEEPTISEKGSRGCLNLPASYHLYIGNTKI